MCTPFLSLSLALSGEKFNVTLRPLYPRETDGVNIVYEAVWAPGPMSTCVKIYPTRIRSPDRVWSI